MERDDRTSRWRSSAAMTIGGLLLYVLAYAVACRSRVPAANMAYFYYLGPAVWDETLYCVFWPVYELHRVTIGTYRHNRDRPDMPVQTGP